MSCSQSEESILESLLGDSLGSLTNGVLGKFTRQHEAYGSLDLSAAEGSLLVVGRKLSCLGGNALEDIIDEGVHDGHALLGDTGVRVDLFQHLVDVGAVRLGTLRALLAIAGLLRGLGTLLGRGLSHGYSLFGLLEMFWMRDCSIDRLCALHLNGQP